MTWFTYQHVASAVAKERALEMSARGYRMTAYIYIPYEKKQQ
jgi:hypothetical protein